MNRAALLYFSIFILSALLYLRLDKIDPFKDFYFQFPNQQKCIRNLLLPYTTERDIKLFSLLPVFINQCSYNLLRNYFTTVQDGSRSLLFLPAEKLETKREIVPHLQFLFSDDQCVIVHATESTPDFKMELKMKKMWPLCKLVKMNTQSVPDGISEIEMVRATLEMTVDSRKFRRNETSVDLDTLLRVLLNSRYIEALYLDELVSLDGLVRSSEQNHFAKKFPVCQLTVVLLRPTNENDMEKFWNFILHFVANSPMVLVSSRVIHQDKIDLVFYNPVYESCNFKHFSIPFNKKGVKF